MSSTEEPRLIYFELEVCPFQLRLAVAPEQTMLYGVKSEDGQIHSVDLPYQGNERRGESLLQSLHWLILANGILDLPEVMPRAAFRMRAMNQDSVHLRVAYSDQRKWACMYLPEEVPSQVKALIEQAKYLAEREFAQAAPAAASEAK